MKLFAPLALIASIVAAGSAAAAPASLYAPAVTRDADALRVRGVVCRSGPRPTVDMRHLFVTPLDESGRPIAERTAYLSDILALLSAHDLAPSLVTGGGTGSHVIDAELGVLTELQVGSYIFMDREYGDCDLDGSGTPPFATALTVDASVVSANAAGMVTIDAGLKAFATEAGPPPILSGAPAGSTYRFMGDEHLAVIVPEGHSAPALGEQVILVPPHCDPTVNLYESYHVVKDDTLVDIWPVTARGRSR